MSEILYTPQDVADITGITVNHLTREDGPITRVLNTHDWECDRLSPDGKNLTEYGINILENYLSEVGKKGRGVPYEQWKEKQREQFKPKESALALSDNAPLIPVEMYTPLTSEKFGVSALNLTQELGNWSNQQATVTKQRVIDAFRAAYTIPTVQGISEAQTELKEILQKMGGL